MKNLIVCLLFAFAILPGGVARADHACTVDFDKYCAGKVVCGKGACHACLNEHMAQLDAACSKEMQKWDENQEKKLSESAEHVKKAHVCAVDFHKFCAGKVVCGKGACHECLNEHMAQLDKACANTMQKWDEKEEEKLSKAALHK